MTKDLRVVLAKYFQKIHHFELAICLLEKARVSSHQKKEILLALSRIFYQNGEFQKSLDLYQKIETYLKDDQSLKWEIGTAFLATNNFVSALPYFKHFESIASFKNIAYAYIGTILLNLERWKEAEDYLRRALDLIPWNADACKSMIDLLRRTNRFDEIKPFLDQYIKKTQDQYPGYAFMAIHIHNDRFDAKRSLKWYEHGFGLTNFDHAKKYQDNFLFCQGLFDMLLSGYTQALIECNQSEEALKLIRVELKKRPNDSASISRLIDFYLRINDYKSAEKLARRFMRSRKLPGCWLMLALSLSKQRCYKEALHYANIAIEKDPLLINAWLILGDIYINREEWQESIQAINKFLTFLPFDPEGLKNLAFCYERIGQMDQSLELYKKTVELSPLNSDVWFELGEVNKKLERFHDSANAFERALALGRLSKERKRKARLLLEEILDNHSK